LDKWSLNSFFHGAGGRTDAVGAVCDMLRSTRRRRRDPEVGAMIAIVSGHTGEVTCNTEDVSTVSYEVG
jgi:hypothetical protein